MDEEKGAGGGGGAAAPPPGRRMPVGPAAWHLVALVLGVVSCVLIGLDLPDISILPGTFVFGFIGALLQAFSNFVALFRQIPQQRKAPGPRSVNASLQLRTHVTATAFAAAYTLLAYRGFAALHMPAILTLSFLAAGVNYFVFLGLLSSVAADEKAANPEKLVSSGGDIARNVFILLFGLASLAGSIFALTAITPLVFIALLTALGLGLLVWDAVHLGKVPTYFTTGKEHGHMRKGVFWFTQFRLLVSFLALYALVFVAQEVTLGWYYFEWIDEERTSVLFGVVVCLVMAWGLEYFSTVAWLSRLAAAPINAAIEAAPEGSRPSIDSILWDRGLNATRRDA